MRPHEIIDHSSESFKSIFIHMADFYTGPRKSFKDRIFIDCEVVGPAVVAFLGKVTIDADTDIASNDFVEIKDGAAVGNVIVFKDITIRRSTFRGMTILVPEFAKHGIPDEANWITHVAKKNKTA
jgi:hypothetical protein